MPIILKIIPEICQGLFVPQTGLILVFAVENKFGARGDWKEVISGPNFAESVNFLQCACKEFCFVLWCA